MNKQQENWGGDFGNQYIDRNVYKDDAHDAFYLEQYGVKKSEMNQTFLGELDKDIKILEIGCNIGMQLIQLAKMGFKNLYGIEINRHAIVKSRELIKDYPIYILQGVAQELPFKDQSFDLVYTSGVLIHIHPDNISTVIHEINRVSAQYIWGFEYFTENGYQEVSYRGERDMLWKTDFKSLYLNSCSGSTCVKECLYPYKKDETLVDQMFLIQKNNA